MVTPLSIASNKEIQVLEFKKMEFKAYDCLIYEMLYMREVSPPLNIQSDSIMAKLFILEIVLTRAAPAFDNLFVDVYLI